MDTIAGNRSRTLYERASKHIPGGVNSPVRAFRAVGGNPLFIDRAQGALVFDADGNEYVDFVGSWGPMILGHAHPRVIEAIRRAAEKGTSFGAPSEPEVDMAELLCKAIPSIEMVRLVNSGTEAAMSAVRLARGFTGRSHVIKFEGCYHGHVDALLAKAGSGALTLGLPDSAGVPREVTQHTVTVPYNDPAALESVVKQLDGQVAALLVEPVAGNMGVVLPEPGFLEFLRAITERHGIVLICDEIITGFRVGPTGMQGLAGIKPDLTLLGKIIGGGLPVGAYGGRRDIMEHVAPLGPVYQAGTLSGNPLAVTAGLETLRILLEDATFYQRLEEKGRQVAESLLSAARAAGVPVTLNRQGSMMTLFFTEGPVTDFASAKRADVDRFGRWFRGMLGAGVNLAPSQFEAAFVGAAHTDALLERAATAAASVMKELS